MAHGITEHDAMIALFAHGQPWHKLATSIEAVATELGVTAAEVTARMAFEAKGILDQHIGTEPVLTLHPDFAPTIRRIWLGGNGLSKEQIVEAIQKGIEVWDRHQAVVREDTRGQFAITSKGYTPWQNGDAADMFDQVMREAGGATLSCLGTLHGGRRVFVTAKLDEETRIGGTDDVTGYHLLMSNAHDATQAVTWAVVAMRTVCANTHAIALRQSTTGRRKRNTIRLRHTKGLKLRLDEVREALGLVSKAIAVYDEVAQFLAGVQVPDAEALKGFVEALVPPADEGKSDARREKKREAIYGNFMDTRRNAVEGVKGSWWTAYQAVTQFVDHGGNGKDDVGSAEKRFNSALFGGGHDLKTEAFDLALAGASGERFTAHGDGTVTIASPAGTTTVDGSDILGDLLSKPVSTN